MPREARHVRWSALLYVTTMLFDVLPPRRNIRARLASRSPVRANLARPVGRTPTDGSTEETLEKDFTPLPPVTYNAAVQRRRGRVAAEGMPREARHVRWNRLLGSTHSGLEGCTDKPAGDD